MAQPWRAWHCRWVRFTCVAALAVLLASTVGGCTGTHPTTGRGSVTATATSSRSASGTTTPTATGSVSSTSPAGPGVGVWRLLPAAPVTSLPAPVAVWTGAELLMHGFLHYPDRPVTFAYRPATNSWVTLPPGPAALAGLQDSDVAVWTGSQLLVLGPTSARYTPSTNSWQALPLGSRAVGLGVTAWTGRQVLNWDGVCCADQSAAGQVYTPANNSWQAMPTAPLQPRRSAAGAWTGRELIVAGGYAALFESTHTPIPYTTFDDAAAYDPASRTWRTLPPMPTPREGATALWDGSEVLVLGGSAAVDAATLASGVAYNPTTNRWRSLPTMPFSRSDFAAVWTGRQVLVWGGFSGPPAVATTPPNGEAYDPSTNRWSAMPTAPLRGRANPVAAWTGTSLVVWGGADFRGQQATTYTDGASYTPPAH